MKFKNTAKRICAISLLASMVSSGGMITVSAAEQYNNGLFTGLGVIGSFNDWIGDYAAMSDEDDDGIWETVVELEEVTEDMIVELYSEGNSTGKTGINFKVRADSDWALSWGQYEENYDRTQNSSTNLFISEDELTIGDPLKIKVVMDTNGDDYEVWPVYCYVEDEEGWREIPQSRKPDESVEFNSLGVIGNFNNWDMDYVKMTDEDADGIWEATVEIDEVTEGMVTKWYSDEEGSTDLQGVQFKVRADDNWDYSWGEYNTSTETSMNEMTNILIQSDKFTIGEPLRFKVTIDTNGSMDKWPVSYTLLESEYEIVNQNDMRFIVFPDHAVLSGYQGSSEKITIPSKVNGVNVTRIGRSVFSNNYDVKEIVVPDTVTEILDNCFSNCSALQKVTLSSALKEIPGEAFSYCFSLKEIELPEGLEKLGYCAFNDCISLKNITIPSTVKTIDSYAFESCTALESVTFEDGVTGVGYEMFCNCDSLSLVYLPESITSIGSSAFENSEQLKIAGSKNTFAEEYANDNNIPFVDTSEPLLLSLPDKYAVKTGGSISLSGGAVFGAGGYTFNYFYKKASSQSWTRLGTADTTDTEVSFKPGSTDIYNLKVSVKDSKGKTAEKVFLVKAVAEEVVASGSCGQEEGSVGYYLDKTGTLTLFGSGASKNYSYSSGFNKLQNTPWDSYDENGDYIPSPYQIKNVVVESGVTTIGRYMFYDISTLKSVKIADTVNTIGSDAFSECTQLEKAEIPSSVTEIGGYAFYGCHQMTIYGSKDSYAYTFAQDNNIPFFDVSVPLNRTTIDRYAVQNGGSVTVQTSGEYGSGSLSYAYYYRKSGASSWTTLKDYSSTTSVTFTPAEKAQYEVKTVVKDSKNQTAEKICCVRVVDNEVVASGECGEEGSCVSYYLEKGGLLTIFGSGAIKDYSNSQGVFYNLNNTPWDSYDEYNNYIGESPYRIREIFVDSGITSIGSRAFYNLSDLNTVRLSDTVTTINRNAFMYCNSINRIEIPASVTEIDSNAFYSCSQLTIYGEAGSAAQTFANDSGYAFVDITCPVVKNELSTYAVNLGKGISITASAEYGSGNISYAFYYRKSGSTSWTALQSYSSKPSAEFKPSEAGIYELKAVAKDSKGKIGEKVSAVMFSTNEILASGSCAGSVNSTAAYVFDKSETLTVFGAGEMMNYGYGNSDFRNLDEMFGKTTVYDEETEDYIDTEAYRIKNVVVMEGITTVGSRSFHSLDKLKKVTLPSTVTKIGSCAFEYCDSLEEINIPEGLTTIGGAAFESCRSLKKIMLPKSVKDIDSFPFYGCGDDGFVIVGYPGSYASSYAEDYGIPFVDITTPYNESFISAYAVKVGDTVTINGAASYGSGSYTYTYYYKKAASTTWTKIGTADTTNTTASFKTGVKADYNVRVVVKDSKGKTSEKIMNVRSVNKNIVSSGVCGENAYYYMDDNNTLTVFGSGAMYQYEWARSPFYNNDKIQTVVIEDGITRVGQYSFLYCRNLSKAIVNGAVSSSYACFYCVSSDMVVVGTPGSEMQEYAENMGWEFLDVTVPYLTASLDNYAPAVGSTVTISAGAEYGSGSYSYTYYYKKASSSSWTKISTADAKATTASFKAGVKADYLAKVVVKDSKGKTSEKQFIVRSGANNVKVSGECNGKDSALSYILDKDGILTVFGSGDMKNYSNDSLNTVSPFSKLSGYGGDNDEPSEESSENTNNSRQYIHKVIIEKGVTGIGNLSFFAMDDLTEVTLSDTVTKLGENAFGCCDNLQKIYIPASVTEIADNSFWDETPVIIFGTSGTNAEQYAADKQLRFADVSNPFITTEVDHIIAKPRTAVKITSVGEYGSGKYSYAFYSKKIGAASWTTLKSLSTVNNAEFSAEEEGTYLIRSLVKDSTGKKVDTYTVVKVTNETYKECGYIAKEGNRVGYMIDDYGKVIIFGDGETKDYYNSTSPLRDNDSIRSVKIEEGITALGDELFKYCSYLSTVELPQSLKKIGTYVFYGTDLEQLLIPAGVESIGEYMASYNNITIVGNSGTAAEQYAADNNYTFIDISKPQNNTVLESYAVPVGGVVNIKASASYGSGNYTFSYYYKKSTSSTWTRIGDANTTLTTASFKTGVKADYDIKVIVKDSKGKSAERYLKVRSTNAMIYSSGECGNGVYYLLDKSGNLSVFGNGTMNDYDYNSEVFNSSDKMSYSEDGEGVRIRTVQVEKGVTGIGRYAFYGLKKLESAVLAEGVESIGEYAFDNCSALKMIEIPATVTSIGEGGLGYRSNLVVCGMKDSFAETYAADNNLIFADISQPLNLSTADKYGLRKGEKVRLTASAKYGSGKYTYSYSYRTEGAENWTALSDGYVTKSSYDFTAPSVGRFEVCISVKDSNNKVVDQIFKLRVVKENVFSSGICGKSNNVFYMLDENGVLTIFGEGAISDYSWSDSVFYNNGNINQVVIEDGITRIGEYLFSECSKLRKVFISRDVTSIAKSAFSYTYNVVLYSYDDTKAKAFAEANSMDFVNVAVPYLNAELDNYAVKVGDTVNVSASAEFGSGGYTFNYYYKKATSSSWTRLGDADTTAASVSFKTASKADYNVRVVVTDSEGNTTEKILVVRATGDKVVVSGECGAKNTAVSYYLNSEGTMTVFGSGAMRDYNSYESPLYRMTVSDGELDTAKVINKVVVDKGVTRVGKNAFQSIQSLYYVEIADTVTSIGYHAFEECRNMRKAEIPGSVTKMENYCFGNCGNMYICGIVDSTAYLYASQNKYLFVDITLPYNESTIDSYARHIGDSFTINAATSYGKGSYKYTYQYKKTSESEWTTLGTEDTSETTATLTLNVAGNYDVRVTSKDSSDNVSYKFFLVKYSSGIVTESGFCGTSGSEVAYMLDPSGTLTVFGKGSIWDRQVYSAHADRVRKIVVEQGIEEIGEYAFNSCYNVKEVILPDGLRKICYDSFENCSGLSRVIIPESVTNINNYAFEYIDSLEICGVPGTEAEAFTGRNTQMTFVDITKPNNLSAASACALKLGTDITITAAAEFGSGSYEYGYSYRMAGENAWTALSSGYTADSSFVFTPEKVGDYELKSTVKDSSGKISEKVMLCRVTSADVVSSGSIGAPGSMVNYMIDSEGTLTIFGSGETADYSWNTYMFGRNYDDNIIRPTIKAIVVEEGITTIGSYLFEYCSQATSLTLPDSLRNIHTCAFEYCSSLKEVVFPKGISSIYDQVFWGCDSLVMCGYEDSAARKYADNNQLPFVSVEKPYNLSSLSAYGVKVGATVTVNGEAMFGEGGYTFDYFYKKSTSSTWTRIGQAATTEKQASFKTGAAAIYEVKVVVTDSKGNASEKQFKVKAVNANIIKSGSCGRRGGYNDVFYYVDDTYTMTVFGSGAMENGTLFGSVEDEVTNLVIEQGVTAIGDENFRGFNNLKTVTLPEGLVRIGTDGFRYCNSLENPVLPSTLTSIGGGAFMYCTSLTAVTIPSGVTTLSENLFEDCDKLANVVLPESLRNIEYDAFEGCSSLDDIVLGKNVSYISSMAFNGAKQIILCGVPGSYVQSYAKQNNMEFADSFVPLNKSVIDHVSVKVGNSVTMTAAAKYGSGTCTYTYYYKKASSSYWTRIGTADTTQTTASFKAGSATDYVGRVVVKDSSGKTSEKLFNVRASANDIIADGKCGTQSCYMLDSKGKLTIFGIGAVTERFSNLMQYDEKSRDICENIKSVEIGSGITNIGASAFANCYNMSTVSIPDTVTSIEGNAFYDSGLTSVVVPGSVKTIGTGAFENCEKLMSVTLNEGLLRIGNEVFENCDKLETVTIPASVVTIGSNVFNESEKLRAIIVSEDNEAYSSESGVLYNKEKTQLIRMPIANESTSFVVPSGVKEIIGNAFRDCNNLISVTVSDSVTDIYNSAFACCKNLESIELPDSIVYMGEFALNSCESLKQLRMPAYLSYVPSTICQSCKNLTNVVMPGKATMIGEFAFNMCEKLENVTIPKTVVEIGSNAFSNTPLKNVALPEKLEVIGSSAFSNCEQLETIELPSGLISIGSSAFRGCIRLTGVEVPESVTVLSNWTFESCSNLCHVVLPETLTAIGSGAFDGTNLAELYIPESVVSIGDNVFRNIFDLHILGKSGTVAESYANENNIEFCDVDKPINYSYVDSNVVKVGAQVDIHGDAEYGAGGFTYGYYYKKASSKNWTAINSGFTASTTASFKPGMAADYDVKVTVKDSSGNTSDRIIQVRSTNADVVESGMLGRNNSQVYYMVDSAGKMTIFGKGEIRDYNPASAVFADKDAILSVTVEDGVTSIGDYLFNECKNLKTVTMANSVVSVGGCAFRECTKLSTVTLSTGLKNIGNYCFFNCTSLKNVTLPASMTTMGGGCFAGCSALESAVIPSGIIYLPYETFSGCSALTTVTLPEGIKAVEGYSFSNCKSLKAITLPSTVVYLGYCAFGDCTALEEITLPKSFSQYDYQIFKDCTSMKAIKVAPENELYVSVDGVIYTKDMKALLMVPQGISGAYTVPDGVQRIGGLAFNGCEKLEKVTMSDTVLSLGYSSLFGNCTSLKEVRLSANLKEIPNGCFRNCASLKEIVIPTSVKYIGYEAFSEIEGLTLKGKEGSYAQQYAEKNDITFVPIETSLTNNSYLSKTTVYVGEQVDIHGAASDGTGDCSFAYYYKKSTSQNWTAIGSGYVPDTTASFKPGMEAEYMIKVVAKDSSGKTAEKQFTVTAKKAAALSNTSTVSATTVNKGTEVKVNAKATGGTGSYTYAYYYKKSTSKNWTAISSGYIADTVVSFTPGMAATYEVKVIAKDGLGTTAEKIITITSK